MIDTESKPVNTDTGIWHKPNQYPDFNGDSQVLVEYHNHQYGFWEVGKDEPEYPIIRWCYMDSLNIDTLIQSHTQLENENLELKKIVDHFRCGFCGGFDCKGECELQEPEQEREPTRDMLLDAGLI